MTEKEIEFKNAVDDLLKIYNELGLIFPRLIQMFANEPDNYVGVAKRLVNSFDVTTGYIKLLEKSRLDLSIESLVADDSRWGNLFEKETYRNAKQKILSS